MIDRLHPGGEQGVELGQVIQFAAGADLDEELGDEDVDIAVDADEDVEEELTLDGDDEDEGFPEKPEGLLDDADDYHTH